jgi:copper homeostasis protein
MKIEVIVQNVEDAIAAEKYGAGRLELVTGMSEGGLTPSYGTIKRVIAAVNIPVQVMVRPHSCSFHYQKEDVEIIIEDIRVMKELGVKGIVFGCLNHDGNVDEPLLEKVLESAEGLDVTFHRAIDEAKDLLRSYEVLCKYSGAIKRVLTSGGYNTAQEGLAEMAELIKRQKELNGPKIMPGSGLNDSDLPEMHNFLKTEEYHFGAGVRVEGSYCQPIDQKKIDRVGEILK